MALPILVFASASAFCSITPPAWYISICFLRSWSTLALGTASETIPFSVSATTLRPAVIAFSNSLSKALPRLDAIQLSMLRLASSRPRAVPSLFSSCLAVSASIFCKDCSTLPMICGCSKALFAFLLSSSMTVSIDTSGLPAFLILSSNRLLVFPISSITVL